MKYLLLFLLSQIPFLVFGQKIRYDQKNEQLAFTAKRLQQAFTQANALPYNIKLLVKPKAGIDTFLIEKKGKKTVITGSTPNEVVRGAFQVIAEIEASQRAQYLFEEKEGWVSVEAEHYQLQLLTQKRRWYESSANSFPQGMSDGDSLHYATASGKAYLEILPDTRRNHKEKLIGGENFSNQPGKLAQLDYRIYFNNPGKYYVWVRAYSTGSEDNGIHVGLNGNWVETGQRMQWCKGKHQWTWASKQRTKEVHCGVEKRIYLDIPTTGWHTISFSMREDGFEFDKFILSQQYQQPESVGMPERYYKNN